MRMRVTFDFAYSEVRMATKISVGDLFSSYEELETKISSYQKENFVQLARRDSRTLDVARKRVPKRVEKANPSLVYYTIHFACVFGGKKYKNEGTGQRSQQKYVQSSIIVTEITETSNLQNN